jgi:caffeoyl-CoA O-methyltransferase
MSVPPWAAIVDPAMTAYAAAHTSPASATLRSVAASTRAWSDRSGLMIDEAEGRLLHLLVAVTGARAILEIGTFSGYSALAMAEALPPDGHLDTLELDPNHARKAREHLHEAGERRVVVHEGVALETLGSLSGPYDLVFIDADKAAYPDYLEAVLGLVRPGALIVADNVLRHGHVVDEESADPTIVGMRRFNDRAATDPRLETVLLTVRDGVSLIRVLA